MSKVAISNNNNKHLLNTYYWVLWVPGTSNFIMMLTLYSRSKKKVRLLSPRRGMRVGLCYKQIIKQPTTFLEHLTYIYAVHFLSSIWLPGLFLVLNSSSQGKQSTIYKHTLIQSSRWTTYLWPGLETGRIPRLWIVLMLLDISGHPETKALDQRPI